MFNFDKTALVMIDVQNDFIDGALGSPQAEKALEVINKVVDLPFGYYFATFDTHYNDYFNTLEGKKLPVSHCRYNTIGWYTPDSIYDICEDKEVFCYNKETFGSIALAEHIKYLYYTKMIDQVVFVGYCTDICVISNVLLTKAETVDMPIFVVEDACAGVTDDLHKAAIEVMKSCHIDIISKDDLIKDALEDTVNDLVDNNFI